jgi:hypothetical protein
MCKKNAYWLSLTMALSVLFLTACETIPTSSNASLEYGSENTVALRYVDEHDWWGEDLSPPAEVIDMAIIHCKKYLKGMKHLHSVKDLGHISNEVHTFQCTNDHVDEKIEIELK